MPGMDVCMSANNRGKLRFSTALFFAGNDVKFQGDEFFPTITGFVGTACAIIIHKPVCVFLQHEGDFFMGLKNNFLLRH